MENNKNLAELTKEVSSLLLNCITLVEIFYEITDGNRKECFIINSLNKNIKTAFDYIEESRQLISDPD